MFVHLSYLPLWPVGSVWMTNEPGSHAALVKSAVRGSAQVHTKRTFCDATIFHDSKRRGHHKLCCDCSQVFHAGDAEPGFGDGPGVPARAPRGLPGAAALAAKPATATPVTARPSSARPSLRYGDRASLKAPLRAFG